MKQVGTGIEQFGSKFRAIFRVMLIVARKNPLQPLYHFSYPLLSDE